MATHIVVQGECLSSIAHHYGLHDWRIIYDHPDNAGFRAKRPDPNLIYPGDELYIPDLNRGDEDCPTDRRHVFVAKFPPTWVNLCVQSAADKPMANVPYRLTIDTLTIEDVTDGKGWVRRRIPAWAEYGTLMVWPNPLDLENYITWRVALGHLDPIDTTSGVKARLANLGYECGEINDEEDDAYSAAVIQFQEDHDLQVDGIVGPQTRGKLKQEHRV